MLRIAVGILFVLNGIILYKLGLPGPGTGSHVLQVFFVLSGLFCIIEGIAGWCAARALGGAQGRDGSPSRPRAGIATGTDKSSSHATR